MESNAPNTESQLQTVMIYAAGLELEVDRLRKKDQFLQQAARSYVDEIQQACSGTSRQGRLDYLPAVVASSQRFSEVLQDLKDPPGYYPASDQVKPIALRPLVEGIFRWQQRLSDVQGAVLRLDLEAEQIVWFPARLCHILDNLIASALRHPAPSKGEIRVSLSMSISRDAYELQVSDNSLSVTDEHVDSIKELFGRSTSARSANQEGGFAIVKLLIEQCCGSISVSGGKGQGINVMVELPRYDMDDYID